MNFKKNKFLKYSAYLVLSSMLLMIAVTSVHFHPAIINENQISIITHQNVTSQPHHSAKNCYVINYLNSGKIFTGNENITVALEKNSTELTLIVSLPELQSIKNIPARAPPIS